MARVRRNRFQQQRLEVFHRTLLVDAGVMLSNEMKRTLSQPGSGRWYPKQPTRSSAPGEPPAAQTGTLRRSIQIDITHLAQYRVRVGTNLVYAPYLEFGTRKMRPRPWFRRSIARAVPRINRMIRRRILEAPV